MLPRTWKPAATVAGLALVLIAPPAVAAQPPGIGVTAAPAAASTASTGLLRNGSRGDAVRAWQRALDQAVAAGLVPGRALAVDGIFGAATHRATVALQRRLGVPQDGVVGPVTREGIAGLLDGATPAPAAPVQDGDRLLRSGLRGEDVRAWQRVVNRAVAAGGVEHRRISEDGVFGPLTRSATRAVQARLGITQDGIVGPRTREGIAGLLDA